MLYVPRVTSIVTSPLVFDRVTSTCCGSSMPNCPLTTPICPLTTAGSLLIIGGTVA
jgi:hypothetical protein